MILVKSGYVSCLDQVFMAKRITPYWSPWPFSMSGYYMDFNHTRKSRLGTGLVILKRFPAEL